MQTSESPISPVSRDQTEDFLNFLPGQRLRRARELRGLTIKDIAQELNLSVRFIEAIERDHYDLLPGVAFARGYMRSYARLLQLDENDVVNKFDQALETRSSDPSLTEVNPVRILGAVQRPRITSLSKVLTYASILVVLAMVGGAFIWSSRETFNPGAGLAQEAHHALPIAVIEPKPVVLHPEPVPSVAVKIYAPVPAVPPVVEPQSQQKSVSVPLPVPVVLPEPSAQAKQGDHSVILSLVQPSWLRVTDASGQVVAVGMHTGGEQISLSGTPPWHLRIGNAEHVHIDQDGKAVDLTAYTQNHVADFELKP